MKIWILTSGRYSDYRVDGVFSTKERAEAAKYLFSEPNDPFEMEIDQLTSRVNLGQSLWTVQMQNDGSAVATLKYYGASDVNDCIFERWHDRFLCTCWADSEEHAIKISNEKRIMWLANAQAEPKP